MGLCMISFTEKGMQLSERIVRKLDNEEAAAFTKWSYAKSGHSTSSVPYVAESVYDWTRAQMKEKNCLLFIGACGIAVRAIAPCITDKLQDSPVLVMDEKGEYIIPILSGHMGGANEIAVWLASRLGAVPVITTATDLNGKFAVDLFAKRNRLHIVNREGIAKVSAGGLQGRKITVSVETGHLKEAEGLKETEGIRVVSYPPEQPVDVVVTSEKKDFDALIYLRPKEYVIGMGCIKGKEEEKIEEFIDRNIQEAGILKNQVFALASIDRKKEEQGFLAWCRKESIPFLTFSAEQLQEIEGSFHASAFVKEQVGVDNVCERAALKACETGGRIICEKHAEDGMTLAIAKRDWSVSFEEE